MEKLEVLVELVQVSLKKLKSLFQEEGWRFHMSEFI